MSGCPWHGPGRPVRRVRRPRDGARRSCATATSARRTWLSSTGRSQPDPGGHPAHGQIGGEQDVGIAERSHQHVVGRPRADPGYAEQGRAGRAAVGAGVEHDVARARAVARATTARPRARGMASVVGSPAASSSGEGNSQPGSSSKTRCPTRPRSWRRSSGPRPGTPAGRPPCGWPSPVRRRHRVIATPAGRRPRGPARGRRTAPRRWRGGRRPDRAAGGPGPPPRSGHVGPSAAVRPGSSPDRRGTGHPPRRVRQPQRPGVNARRRNARPRRSRANPATAGCAPGPSARR